MAGDGGFVLLPSGVSATVLDTAELSPREAYGVLTSLVVPRPIAWVSTVGRDGRGNLAPFSYFQAVCSRPPTVMLSIAWRPDGTPKDTLRNILDTEAFSISVVDAPLAESMNRTSAEFPPGTSEWEAVGIASAPGSRIPVPRVAEASAALECRLVHAVPMGTGRSGAPSVTVVFGRVVAVVVRDDLVVRDTSGRPCGVDGKRIAPVGRLGGTAYVTTDHRFDLSRPKVPEEEPA